MTRAPLGWKSRKETFAYASKTSASSVGAEAIMRFASHRIRSLPDIRRWFWREMNYQSLALSRAVAVGSPYPAELLCRLFSVVAGLICAEILADWVVAPCGMAIRFRWGRVRSG